MISRKRSRRTQKSALGASVFVTWNRQEIECIEEIKPASILSCWLFELAFKKTRANKKSDQVNVMGSQVDFFGLAVWVRPAPVNMRESIS